MIEFNEYRWFKIDPVDAWFFRDGRPSNRDEDQSDLESEFPPNAATLVGAVRAALARENGWKGTSSWADNVKLKFVLGDGFDDLGQVRFLGPLLMERDDLLWPMPQHIVGHMVETHADSGKLRYQFQPTGMLEPSEDVVLCDAGQIRLPHWKKQALSFDKGNWEKRPPEPLTGGFVTSKGMSNILCGRLPDADDCRIRDQLFLHEPRVGILRKEDTRTTGPNAMYSPRYVRLRRGVTLTIGVAGLPGDWQLSPVFALGGESRMAGVETLQQTPDFPSGNYSGGYHLVITATPALFSDRWWGAGPGDDAANLSPNLSGAIATMMLDRPRRIGGWNSIAGSPLPLRPFVPPGTVWWIESTKTSQTQVLQIGQSTVYGYGLTLVSGPKEN